VSWDRTALLLTITAVGACAGATRQAGHGSCALAPADSIYLAGGPVYRECAVERRARRLNQGERPEFRPTDPPFGGAACYSAEIEFVVDTTGTPELQTARVVRTNNPNFAEAVLVTLPRWRYQSARNNGLPVRQIVREKQAMAVQVVVVRQGQVPRPGRPPRC